MIEATERQLASGGITEQPEVVARDAGYWHQEQMEQLAAAGCRC